MNIYLYIKEKGLCNVRIYYSTKRDSCYHVLFIVSSWSLEVETEWSSLHSCFNPHVTNLPKTTRTYSASLYSAVILHMTENYISVCSCLDMEECFIVERFTCPIKFFLVQSLFGQARFVTQSLKLHMQIFKFSMWFMESVVWILPM